jgi:Mce-associated membrane protein
MSGNRGQRTRWWFLVGSLVIAIALTVGVGVWQSIQGRLDENAVAAPARQAVMDVASSAMHKMLSYTPDTAEQTLTQSVSLLTGDFRDSYHKLITDVVIPGAKQKQITATGTAAAVSVESLTADKATVIVFVNQTVTVGSEPPKDTASSVRLGMVRIDDAWLINQFDPI